MIVNSLGKIKINSLRITDAILESLMTVKGIFPQRDWVFHAKYTEAEESPKSSFRHPSGHCACFSMTHITKLRGHLGPTSWQFWLKAGVANMLCAELRAVVQQPCQWAHLFDRAH